MRKIIITFRGKEYRVDSDDINDIIRHYRLDSELNSEKRRLASLGLMYLDQFSWQGGGASDMKLWDSSDGTTGDQKELLNPALESIAQYFDNKIAIERTRQF